MDDEGRLPVPGYRGSYEVSDAGRVRSLARIDASGHRRKSRILRPRPDRGGYLMVDLYRNGVQVTYKVHRLVLLAHVGPCPDGMEGCHANDQPDDNRLSNLRWDTPDGNMGDRFQRQRLRFRVQCAKGHFLAGENLYMTPAGYRECRKCRQVSHREHYERRKAALWPKLRTLTKTFAI
jgi:hypothetical protein